ncbi:MAG: hypothetical protein ACRC62_14295 [Microcoleus sp.]
MLAIDRTVIYVMPEELNCQLSTINEEGGHGGTAPTNSSGGHSWHRPYQLSIASERGRSHYNCQLSTINSQLSTINRLHLSK